MMKIKYYFFSCFIVFVYFITLSAQLPEVSKIQSLSTQRPHPEFMMYPKYVDYSNYTESFGSHGFVDQVPDIGKVVPLRPDL